MEIVARPSPNHGDRRGGARVELIVLHHTAMAVCEDALGRLCNPQHEVSSHYLIGREGTLYCLVDEAHRAWHAGEGRWAGRDDVNSRSIGIELDNDGSSAFDEDLMTTLEALLEDLLQRHELHPKAVIAHSDMAPGRKNDPGPWFEWKRLADKGLSVWPDPALQGDFMRDAAFFGYPVEAGEAAVLAAFRQRFRPFAEGPIGIADRAMMAGLARHYPSDVTERTASRVPTRPFRSL